MTIDIDWRQPEVIADPYPAFAALRAQAPVHWDPRLRSWLITRFDDVQAGLKDKRLSANRIRPFVDQFGGLEKDDVHLLGDTLEHWAVFNDPPDHTRLRGLMNKAFTSHAIEGLRPRVVEIVDELLDDLDGRDEIDLIADFAYPLPATVIAELMGVPRSDVDLLKDWSDKLATFVLTSRANPERYELAAKGIAEMTDYFGRLLDEHRRKPASDVTFGLIAAQEEGDRLTADELVATCILLLFAGHETTTQLLGNGSMALLRTPDQMAALHEARDDRKVVRNAVEEMLRWDGPALSTVRVAAETFELRGHEIREGDRVFLFNAAANRDPEAFEDPDVFDIARDGAARHVGFGWGIHFCIGAPLARLEGEIAFPRLLGRLGRIYLADEDPPWSDSLLARGLIRLPVRVMRD